MKLVGFCLIIIAAAFFYYSQLQSELAPEPRKLSKLENLEKAEFKPSEHKLISKVTAVVKTQNKASKGPKKSAKDQAKEKKQYFKKLLDLNVISYDTWDGKAVFDGDILLGELTDGPPQGLLEIPPVQRWESAHIPYGFSENFPEDRKEIVMGALNYFKERTALRFHPVRAADKDFIIFKAVEEEKCASYLGRQEGGQYIYLGPSCGQQSVLHEMLHALGFAHEHSRFDRDKFLKINWENMEQDKAIQFALMGEHLLLREQLDDFDYASIMIYSAYAFSANQKPTIETITKDLVRPTEAGLSPNDLRRLRLYFE